MAFEDFISTKHSVIEWAHTAELDNTPALTAV